jgi:hypothetical protein
MSASVCMHEGQIVASLYDLRTIWQARYEEAHVLGKRSAAIDYQTNRFCPPNFS